MLNNFSISLYIFSDIQLTLLAVNGWNLLCWHRFILLSTRYIIFSDVVFIFVIYFSIGFTVRSIKVDPHLKKRFYLSFLKRYITFNGSLKLIFNRNNCLNFIIKFLSKPKIFSEDIQTFNYFLHMIDFGHAGELLKKRAIFSQMACSDINNK